MSHTAVCVAPAPEQATAIIDELRQAGFTADEVAVLATGLPLTRSGPRLAAHASLGALLGCGLAWLPALAAPGALPAILIGALGGAALALARPGRPRRAGPVLISVQTANGYEVETIVDIFRAAGAHHRTWSGGRRSTLASVDPAPASVA